MANKDIIRKGDKVKIITPNMFIRCGYPFSLDDARKEIDDKHRDKINEFLHSFGFGKPLILFEKEIRSVDNKGLPEDDPVYRKVRDAIAYELVRSRKFGGRERSIHTRYEKECEGKIFKVEYINYVHTGTYHDGYFSRGGYYDPPEYDPPYLENEKTHKILTGLSSSPLIFVGSDDLLRIEDCWVQKV